MKRIQGNTHEINSYSSLSCGDRSRIFYSHQVGVIDGQEVIYPVRGGKEPASINQTVIIRPL